MHAATNKFALITGAGEGIGHAICKALHKDGIKIIAVARNKENLNTLCNELDDRLNHYWSIDLSTDEGQQELFGKLSELNFPDIVVCNMNVPSEKKRVINTTKKEFAENFTINIDHLFAIMEKTLQHQREQKFGRWIAVSSFASQIGLPGQTIYNAQKSAMQSVFLNIAVEEGKYGITSNIISPGFIETPATLQRISKDVFQKASSFNILKRAGKPEEIAAAVSFLASENAGFITGVDLPVNGGAQLAWHLT